MHSARRLHFALALAACAHAAIFASAGAIPRAPKPSLLEIPARPSPTELFLLSADLLETPEPPAAKQSVTSVIARGAIAMAKERPSSRSHQEPATDAIETTPGEDAPRAIDDNEHRPNPGAPVDLGLGSLWKSVAASAPSTPEGESAHAPSPYFRDALDAHDHELGLSRSGPLVTAAHDAASIPQAPDTGNAVFEVDADPSGKVTSASVVSFSTDLSGWTRVAEELVAVMGSKTLRVPPGSRGLRIRLRISAERTSPSGDEGRTRAGAVPDDVPGADPVCVGAGWSRKCLKGMPVGATMNTVDIANLGANASRIVRAQILAERAL